MKAVFNKLDSVEKLEELIKLSEEKPILLFKHSTTCPISDQVYREVSDVKSDVNLVIVQTARGISNEIEARTGVRHQSPQVIVLKDGKPIYNASHYDITAEDLEKILN